MNYKDLKKMLRKAGIGGTFGRGIRLFDLEYADVPFNDMNSMVLFSTNGLKNLGLEWKENISDCDNWSLWIMADVSKQWAIENRETSKAIPFGRANMKGHDTNIGVADGKIYFWDYGVLKDFDPKTIRECEFK